MSLLLPTPAYIKADLGRAGQVRKKRPGLTGALCPPSRSTPPPCALWGWGPAARCVALEQWWHRLYPRYTQESLQEDGPKGGG